MDEKGRFSISPKTLCSRLGAESGPIAVDFRRSPDFAADAPMIVDAIRCSPEGLHEPPQGTFGSSPTVSTARKRAKTTPRRDPVALPSLSASRQFPQTFMRCTGIGRSSVMRGVEITTRSNWTTPAQAA